MDRQRVYLLTQELKLSLMWRLCGRALGDPVNKDNVRLSLLIATGHYPCKGGLRQPFLRRVSMAQELLQYPPGISTDEPVEIQRI